MQIKTNSVSSVIIDVLACYDETGKSEMQDLGLFMYLGPEHQWCEDAYWNCSVYYLFIF